MSFSKNLMNNLGPSYAKLMMKLTTTLHVSYENVKFAASDVTRETLSSEAVIGRTRIL